MKLLWQATIEEMYKSGMTSQEIKSSLQEMYPEIPELMAYVDEVLGKEASIKRFTKKAQGFGFGYNNSGQTNFSVPNSEGVPGADPRPINPSNASTPSSSYTDHASTLIKQKKETEEQQKKEEERKRREKRKELVNKIATTPAKPGENLRVGPEGTKPGESIERLTKNIDDKIKTIDRTLRTTDREHSVAPQWSEKEQQTDESKITKSPQKVETKSPETPKPSTQTSTQDANKVKKEMKSVTDQGVKDMKTLSDTTKKVKDEVNNLNKSVQNLLK